jgi:hypothetical protein
LGLPNHQREIAITPVKSGNPRQNQMGKVEMGGAKFAAPLGPMAQRSTPLRYRESK